MLKKVDFLEILRNVEKAPDPLQVPIGCIFCTISLEVVQRGTCCFMIAAPRFNVVECLNDWAKAVKLSSELSDVNKLYLRYWQVYEEQALVSETS